MVRVTGKGREGRVLCCHSAWWGARCSRAAAAAGPSLPLWCIASAGDCMYLAFALSAPSIPPLVPEGDSSPLWAPLCSIPPPPPSQLWPHPPPHTHTSPLSGTWRTCRPSCRCWRRSTATQAGGWRRRRWSCTTCTPRSSRWVGQEAGVGPEGGTAGAGEGRVVCVFVCVKGGGGAGGHCASQQGARLRVLRVLQMGCGPALGKRSFSSNKHAWIAYTSAPHAPQCPAHWHRTQLRARCTAPTAPRPPPHPSIHETPVAHLPPCLHRPACAAHQ